MSLLAYFLWNQHSFLVQFPTSPTELNIKDCLTSSFVHRVLSAIEIADKDKTTALSLGYRWCTNRCSRSSTVYGAYASEAHVVVRHAPSCLDITTYSRFKEKHNYYYYFFFFIYWKCSHFVCTGRSMCILTISFHIYIYIYHKLWQVVTIRFQRWLD